MKLEPGQVCGWVSTVREMLARFVETHVPVVYAQTRDANAAGSSSAPPGCLAC